MYNRVKGLRLACLILFFWHEEFSQLSPITPCGLLCIFFCGLSHCTENLTLNDVYLTWRLYTREKVCTLTLDSNQLRVILRKCDSIWSGLMRVRSLLPLITLNQTWDSLSLESSGFPFEYTTNLASRKLQLRLVEIFFFVGGHNTRFRFCGTYVLHPHFLLIDLLVWSEDARITMCKKKWLVSSPTDRAQMVWHYQRCFLLSNLTNLCDHLVIPSTQCNSDMLLL